jgi:hypothetical protein
LKELHNVIGVQIDSIDFSSVIVEFVLLSRLELFFVLLSRLEPFVDDSVLSVFSVVTTTGELFVLFV